MSLSPRLIIGATLPVLLTYYARHVIEKNKHAQTTSAEAGDPNGQQRQTNDNNRKAFKKLLAAAVLLVGTYYLAKKNPNKIAIAKNEMIKALNGIKNILSQPHQVSTNVKSAIITSTNGLKTAYQNSTWANFKNMISGIKQTGVKAIHSTINAVKSARLNSASSVRAQPISRPRAAAIPRPRARR